MSSANFVEIERRMHDFYEYSLGHPTAVQQAQRILLAGRRLETESLDLNSLHHAETAVRKKSPDLKRTNTTTPRYYAPRACLFV